MILDLNWMKSQHEKANSCKEGKTMKRSIEMLYIQSCVQTKMLSGSSTEAYGWLSRSVVESLSTWNLSFKRKTSILRRAQEAETQIFIDSEISNYHKLKYYIVFGTRVRKKMNDKRRFNIVANNKDLENLLKFVQNLLKFWGK